MAQPPSSEINQGVQGVNAADFFRPARGVTFSKTVGGEFAEDYDAWIKHSAGKAEVENKLKQASALKLPDILGKEVVSVVMSLPVESRQNSVVLSGRLMERAVETEKRIATELGKLVADGKIPQEEADGLKGYGFVEMARISANYAASKGAPDAGVVEKTSPIRWGDGVNETEPSVRWEKVMQLVNEADRISGSDEAQKEGVANVLDKLAEAMVPAAVAGATAFGEGVGEAVAAKLSSLKFGKSEGKSKETGETESTAKELKKGDVAALSFEQLRELHETEKWNGKNVQEQELLVAVESEMKSRFEDSRIKTELDELLRTGRLRNILIESQWKDGSWAVAIDGLAQQVENTAQGQAWYRDPRYSGLLRSAVSDLKILIEKDGLSNTEGKDATIEGRWRQGGSTETVSGRLGELNRQEQKVVWKPKLSWKALIDQQTSWQEREAAERSEREEAKKAQTETLQKQLEFMAQNKGAYPEIDWNASQAGISAADKEIFEKADLDEVTAWIKKQLTLIEETNTQESAGAKIKYFLKYMTEHPHLNLGELVEYTKDRLNLGVMASAFSAMEQTMDDNSMAKVVELSKSEFVFGGVEGSQRLDRLWKKAYPGIVKLEGDHNLIRKYLQAKDGATLAAIEKEIGVKLGLDLVELKMVMRMWQATGRRAMWDGILIDKSIPIKNDPKTKRPIYEKALLNFRLGIDLASLIHFDTFLIKKSILDKEMGEQIKIGFADLISWNLSDTEFDENGIDKYGVRKQRKNGIHLESLGGSKLGSIGLSREFGMDVYSDWVDKMAKAFATKKALLAWTSDRSMKNAGAVYGGAYRHLYGKFREPAEVVARHGKDKIPQLSLRDLAVSTVVTISVKEASDRNKTAKGLYLTRTQIADQLRLEIFANSGSGSTDETLRKLVQARLGVSDEAMVNERWANEAIAVVDAFGKLTLPKR